MSHGNTYNLVAGSDTGPQIKLTLTNESTGAAIDLTGGSVVMHFRAVGSTTVLFSRTLVVTDAVNGVALIAWQAGDLDQDAGIYEGEIEITLSTGVIQTVYEALRFRLRDEFA